MDLSRKWLSEFVENSDINDKDFSEAMTLSGSKVEKFTALDDEIKNVVVGKVLEITRHENSDHMWVCQVDVGNEIVQIVTGAQNVKAGDLVPVAKHNSLLPGGKKIEKGMLRGVESCGMLCSLKELGLTLHDYPYAIEDGIWIIEEAAAPGDDVAKLIGADDHVVEFEITPNRPDCLSVIGLARETAATFDRELRLHTPVLKGCGGDINELVDIKIADPELCLRYTAKMVKNVKIAPSPAWMRERLRNSGVRPINNIVDITNYVMLEYGQPMHAFDFSCVEGGKIIIRTAKPGETIETLDGNARNLTESMLCICDENKPVCVAGVMGGANSEIVGDTEMVLFESANFNGTSVRKTAKALGMRTDASARYEKGLDPANTMNAVLRACELVELLGCGEVVDGVIDVFGKEIVKKTVLLEPEKINNLLGTDVSKDEMKKILLKLGFELEGDTIIVPTWRGDVEHYSDIAEEIARFYGYNKIPNTLMKGQTTLGGYSDERLCELGIGAAARNCGYNEIITYSFISPSYYDKINMPADSVERDSIKILNPLGEDTSIMRTTILPSMLEIMARNYSFRNKSVKLYEVGKIYKKNAQGLADEPKMVALGAYGNGMSFYRIKGAVESIFKALGIGNARFVAETKAYSYHPGRCAKIFAGDKYIGIMGQIHPKVAANYGVDEEMYTAELCFDALFDLRGPLAQYKPLAKYPSVTRDIAVVCDDNITVFELEESIRNAGGEILKGIKLFDIYKGVHIAEDKKSVAFSLTLCDENKTLTVEEADAEVKAILAGLEKDYGAVIR